MNRRLVAAATLMLLLGVAVGMRSTGATFSDTSDYDGTVTAAQDWTPPEVTITPLPSYVGGTVTVTADAFDDRTSVTQVTFELAPSGADTWSTLCVDTTSTHSCSWDTTTEADGLYQLRATATDAVGLSSTSGPVETRVVNSEPEDNVAPTVSLSVPTGTLAGTIVLSASADDAGSGVATVSFQYRQDGDATWQICGLGTGAPYTCSLDTTTIAHGSYEFRAIATDHATNSATSAIQTRTVDNTVASVSITSPAAASMVSGTVAVTADAYANQGVASVRIEVRPSGGLWAALCTDTSAPYSCAWATTTNGDHELRAVLTQGNEATLVSTIVPVTVDNSPLGAVDVQAVSSGTAGLPSTGDSLVLTYSALVDPATIKAGWTGAATSLEVDFQDRKLSGALLAGYDRADFPGTNLGQVAFGQNYVGNGLTATFSGSTMEATTDTVGGVQVTVVTITLGTTDQSTNLHATSASAAMTWTPSVLVTTPAGVSCSTAAATETGATDRDL